MCERGRPLKITFSYRWKNPRRIFPTSRDNKVRKGWLKKIKIKNRIPEFVQKWGEMNSTLASAFLFCEWIRLTKNVHKKREGPGKRRPRIYLAKVEEESSTCYRYIAPKLLCARFRYQKVRSDKVSFPHQWDTSGRKCKMASSFLFKSRGVVS